MRCLRRWGVRSARIRGEGDGKKSACSEIAAAAEVQGTAPQPLPAVWPAAGVHSGLRPVPAVFQKARPGGGDPWGEEGELVREDAVTVSDPIADMLTRIRNALERRHSEVVMPSSKMREAIARILKEEGYIEDWQVEEGESYPVLRLRLKYLAEGTRIQRPAIQGLRRISRPSRRVFVRASEIPDAHSGLGICILSTSQGIMTGRKAREMRLGGELLCEIW